MHRFQGIFLGIIVLVLLFAGCSGMNVFTHGSSLEDADGDGVVDSLDCCQGTPRNCEVNEWGCPVDDSDGDGVCDECDECDRLIGMHDKVDCHGCLIGEDPDDDGIGKESDKCPNTLPGVSVNCVGCPLDTDRDGVADYADDNPLDPNLY